MCIFSEEKTQWMLTVRHSEPKMTKLGSRRKIFIFLLQFSFSLFFQKEWLKPNCLYCCVELDRTGMLTVRSKAPCQPKLSKPWFPEHSHIALVLICCSRVKYSVSKMNRGGNTKDKELLSVIPTVRERQSFVRHDNAAHFN